MSLAIEEKYEQVRQLIGIGKERGYLLYDEMNGILPPENDFRCNLLRHAIFQQIITLTTLDAREQALQLIKACRT